MSSFMDWMFKPSEINGENSQYWMQNITNFNTCVTYSDDSKTLIREQPKKGTTKKIDKIFFKKCKILCIFPSMLNVPMTGKTLMRGQPRTGPFLTITTMNFKKFKLFWTILMLWHVPMTGKTLIRGQPKTGTCWLQRKLIQLLKSLKYCVFFQVCWMYQWRVRPSWEGNLGQVHFWQ